MINGLCKRERGVGPSRGAAGGGRRGSFASRGVVALVLGCVLAGALLTAGPASAASRGFMVRNVSRTPITVAGWRALDHIDCIAVFAPNPITKIPGFTGQVKCGPPVPYPIDFSEGRPSVGDRLVPGATQSWELKYWFSIFGGVQYAAIVVYNIPGGVVEYTLRVYSTSNESQCKVIGTSSFTCTAEGLNLTLADKPLLRSGGPSNDTLSGGPGNDNISGGPGNDILSGGPGNDILSGGRGTDRISGGPGNDILSGGRGTDVISGGPGNDTISGGPGNDTIHARDGHRDVIDCGPGRDVAFVDPVDLVRGCERGVR
jgi:hypothetical protein